MFIVHNCYGVDGVYPTGVSSEFGKSYGTYQVHCIKTMPDGKEESWDVPRRYSDFHDLHGIISDRVSSVRNCIILNF